MDTITQITDWLGAHSGDPEVLRLGYSALLGASVFLFALAFWFLATSLWDPLRKRVDAVTAPGDRPARGRSSTEVIAMLGGTLLPKEQARRQRTGELLRHAGFRAEGSARVFYGIKLAATLVGPLLILLTAGLTPLLPGGRAYPLVLVAGALGFLISEIALKHLARRRQERLRRGLPDAMDLLVVCSEAGLGLGAAIQRVASELALAHPELADELGLVSMQTRAGMDNRSALKDLEARTGLEDIQALVTMLLQSMRFGTSIADTLRIFADELRDKRLQRAQEKAARIGTLMIFPLVLCILPSFFLVAVGPPLVGAHNVLNHTGIAR